MQHIHNLTSNYVETVEHEAAQASHMPEGGEISVGASGALWW